MLRGARRRCCRLTRVRFSKRVVTFANQADFISFRHHTYEQPRGAKSVVLKEVNASGSGAASGLARSHPPPCAPQVGPRFELRLYRVKLGTMEQQEAETEWALRPYMRSGKKRKL